MNICRMDPSLTQMSHLQVLNLSFNGLREIVNIPSSLKELYLAGNEISEVNVSKHENLIHLGLSYNKLEFPQLLKITNVFPNLFCLDLSYNNVCDMRNVVSSLKELTCLKMIYLRGNPCAMTPRYKDILKKNFEDVKIIDGKQAFSEGESPSKKRKKKNHVEEHIEIVPTGTLDFEVRLLQNIDGVYITEEMIKPELLEELEP